MEWAADLCPVCDENLNSAQPPGADGVGQRGLAHVRLDVGVGPVCEEKVDLWDATEALVANSNRSKGQKLVCVRTCALCLPVFL